MAKNDEKKVNLFVVEGPTDEVALASILEKILCGKRTVFEVIHGDITLEGRWGGSSNEPKERVRKRVLTHLEQNNGYGWRDLSRIVLLCDTDGAFVDDDLVVPSGGERLLYGEDCIRAADADGIRKRNRHKKKAMAALRQCSYLTYKKTQVPFEVYYMSRNLEHALYGVARECTDEEKTDMAYDFRRRYVDDIEGFRELVNGEIAVPGSYGDTWGYIAQGANSLSRCSNFHLALSD